KVDLKDIRKARLPELNDDFAQSLGGGLSSLDDLKKMIGDQLTKAAEEEAERQLRDQLLDQLLDKTEFEVPPGLIEQEERRMMTQVESSLARRGMSFQTAGISREKLQADLKGQALRRVQESLILEAIALKEGWQIDEKALEAGFEELAAETGQNPEEIRRFHQENNLVESFKASLLRRQTLKRLLNQANIKARPLADEPETPDSEEKA
ncbi:MAG: hypothetical protein JRJ59_11460, partial [Deltaproteobacteria bacterium]|nr:hypothetical protein [Deltaproteobacteria bacterium]